MTDAAFIWQTNIGDVAAQIESGLGRIRRAVDQGVGKAGGAGSVLSGDRAEFLGAGVEKRARRISQELNKGLSDAARNYERSMREAAKAGVPFRGITPLGGTSPTTSWKEISQPLIGRAQGQFQALSRELGVALQGPLQSVRPQMERYLLGLAENTVAAARRLTDTIAKGGSYTDPVTGRKQTFASGLLGVRDEADVRGVRAQQFTVGGDQMAKEFVRSLRLQPPTPAETGVAPQTSALLSVAGREGAPAARALGAELETRQAALQGAMAEARRVVSEIRANTDRYGRPIDPRGARREGEFFIDRSARRFVADTGPEGSGGLLPAKYLQGPLGEWQRAAEAASDNARVQRHHIDTARAGLQQDRHVQDFRRRALAQELIRAQTQGRADFGGTYARYGTQEVMRGGVPVQEPRYYRFRDGGAEEVTSPAGRHQAQAAVDKELRARTAAEMKARAELEKRVAVERGVRGVQEQTLRGAGGAGGRPPVGVMAGGGGFRDEFGAAVSGQRGRGFRAQDLLGSVMQYSRYMVSAALIGGGIAALRKARMAVVDYRDSLTDLEIAIGNNERVSERFISNLSDVARLAGANTGDAIDAAVRGIRAFGNLDEPPTLERTGTEFADVSAMLAVIAEKDLRNATGDLIAVGSAFDLAEGQFTRVIDAVATAKRQLGGDAKEVSQGLSSIGTAAAEAGFTLEETANVVSLVQARTDQTGRAVAQRLSRIFSIIGGSSGRSALETLNRQLGEDQRIDTTGSVRDQLMQVSQIYDQLSEQQRGFVRNALGGVANQREIIPLLSEPEALARALNEQFGAAGSGFDEFNRKALDLVGIMRKIRGDVEAIFTGLFRAGAFDVFALGVKYGVEPFLNGIRLVINAVNDMRDAFRGVNFITDFIGEWGVRTAIFVAQMRMAKGALGFLQDKGLLRTLSLGGSASSPAAMSPYIGASLGRPSPAFGGTRMAGPVTFGSGLDFRYFGRATDALRSVGSSVRTLGQRAMDFVRANPLLAIVVGLTAFNQALRSMREVLDQVDATREALAEPQVATTAAELRDYAQSLSAAGEQARQARSGFFGWMWDANRIRRRDGLDPEVDESTSAWRRFWSEVSSSIRDSGVLAELQQRAGARSALAIEQADILEERRRAVAGSGRPEDAFDLRTPEGPQEGVQLLREQGRDAVTQFDALTTALRQAGEQADGLSVSLDQLSRLRFGQEVASDVARRFGQVADGLADEGRDSFWTALAPPLRYQTPDGQARQIATQQAQALTDFLNEETLSALNEYSVALIDRSGGFIDDQNREVITGLLQEWVRGNSEEYRVLTDDVRQLLDEAIFGSVEEIAQTFMEPDQAGLIDQAILQAGMALARERASVLGARSRLSGEGSASLVEAEEAVLGLQRLYDMMEEKGLAASQLELIRNEVDQAELSYIEVQTQRARDLAALASSERSPSDNIGRLQDEITALRQVMEITKDEEGLDRLQVELNGLYSQRAEAIRNRAAAELRAGTDARDAVATATAEATIALRELTDLENSGAEGTQAYFEAQRSSSEAMVAHSMALLEQANAVAVMQIDSRDTVSLAQQEASHIFQQMMVLEEAGLGNSVMMNDMRRQFAVAVVNGARQELAMASATQQYVRSLYEQLRQIINSMMSSINYVGDSWGRAIGRAQAHAGSGVQAILGRIRGFAEIGQAVNTGLSALPSTITDPNAFDTSKKTLDTLRRTLFDPRDDVARARAALTDAQRELNRQARGSVEYHNQLQAVREAQVALADAIRGRTAASRGAADDPKSGVQRARTAVLNARDDVRDALSGTTAWFQAVASLNSAQVDYGEALERARMESRLIGRDSSDPVVVAREELRRQRRVLERARSRGAPEDVLNEMQLSVRGAEESYEQARLSQWMTDLDNRRSLGQITHQAYIRFVEQEIARMQSYETMTRAQHDQLIRLQLALKAAKDQVDAQFNLGDIRMPTPYEVRRAIAGRGDAFNPGSGVVSSVVNNTSTEVTNFISVDGANMDEVERVLRRLLTSGTTATYTAGSRRL